MASEIRVNQLTNRAGLGTITFANGGVQFSGITTFANGEFYVGTGATIINPSTNEFNFHTGGSNRLTINNSGVSIPGALSYEDVKNVDSVGVVTVRSGGYLDVRTGGSINTNATGGSASGTLHKNTTSGEFAVVSGGTGGNNHLTFYTSASAAPTEKLRIASDGKVGIGTEIPSELLEIASSIGCGIAIKDDNNGFAASKIKVENGGRDLSIGAPQDIFFKDIDTGTKHLYIESTGHIGIGTDNPTEKLDVLGNIKVRQPAGTEAKIQINEATTNNAFNIKQTATEALIQTTASQPLNIRAQAGSGSNSYLSFWTRDDERLRITSDGKIGIGSAAPTSVLDIVAADPVLTLRDTSATVTNANATLRLAESDANGVIENYWDVVADPTAGNFGFAIKQNLGGTTNTRFAIQPSTGNIGIAQINPQHKLHVVGDIYASDDLIAGDEIRNKVPADFWASDNTFINLNDVGNITHMGGYQTTITSNGYRDTNTQWKSNAINSNTGAAQIVLHPTGVITFGTESNKSDGSSWIVDTKLRITADGRMGLNTGVNPHAYLDVNTDETLSATAGIGLTIAEFRGAVGNASQLEFKHVRLSAGNDWTTVATRIQKKIDATEMGYIDFGTGGGGSGRDIQFGTGNGTIMMHLDNAGKVGIGTDNPDTKLEVFGGATSIQVGNQSGLGRFGADGTSTKLGSHSNHHLDLFTNGSSNTRLRINSDGRVLIGHTSARIISTTVNPFFQLEGTNYNAALSVVRNSANSPGPYIILGKSRNASVGGSTILQDNDVLGSIRFVGADGVDMAQYGAEISVLVDGTPGTDSMPGEMIFRTNTGSGNPTEKLRITKQGIVSINDSTPVSWATLQIKNHTTHNAAQILLHGADLAQIIMRDDTGATNQKCTTIRNDQGDLIFGTHNDAYSGFSEKFKIAQDGTTTATGTSDGVLQLDTSDSRGAFIRFGQGGSYHHMIGCADGLVAGPDKEDLGIRAKDNMVFCTNGANEALRIDSSGNLMIGRTSASKKFSVRETSTSSGVYYNAQIGGASHLVNYAVGIAFDPEGYTARTKIGIVAEGTSSGYSRGKLHFLLDSANDSGEATLAESRMTILDSGRVGINEVSPDAPLHITGGLPHIRLENSGTSASANDVFGQIDFKHNDSDDAGVTAAIKCVAEDNAGNSFLAFYNGDGGNADERLRITSDGYVTKPNTPYFHVQGSPSINNTPFDNGVKSFSNVRSNNGSHYDNSTGVFTCPVAGFYFFSASLWSSSSDANNGDRYALLIRRDSNGNNQVQFAGANHHDQWDSLTMAAGYYCALGDQIYVFYNGSTQGSTPRHYFSGCLIG